MPVIAAGIIAAGSLAGGYIASQGQEDANATNAASAQSQIDFQREMSNTSYQRGVKDMQAAGLNPMLAYSRGGATTPTGAMSHAENTMEPLGAGVSNAAQAAGRAVELKNTEANTQLATQNAIKAAAETRVSNATAEQLEKQTDSRYPEAISSEKTAQAKLANLNAEFGIAQHELQLAKTNLEAQEIKQRINVIKQTMASIVSSAESESEILKSQVPGAQNKMKSDLTWYGKNVRPYIHDASSAAGTAGKLYLFNRLMGGRGQ